MDPRSPITGRIVHPAFDGENLERSKWAADRPFQYTPGESFWIVAVTLAAIAAVLWRMA